MTAGNIKYSIGASSPDGASDHHGAAAIGQWASGRGAMHAIVAWASSEMPPNHAPRYRARVEFVDAPAAAVDAFRARHQRSAHFPMSCGTRTLTI